MSHQLCISHLQAPKEVGQLVCDADDIVKGYDYIADLQTEIVRRRMVDQEPIARRREMLPEDPQWIKETLEPTKYAAGDDFLNVVTESLVVLKHTLSGMVGVSCLWSWANMSAQCAMSKVRTSDSMHII